MSREILWIYEVHIGQQLWSLVNKKGEMDVEKTEVVETVEPEPEPTAEPEPEPEPEKKRERNAMMHPFELPEFDELSPVSFGRNSPQTPQTPHHHKSMRIFLCSSDTTCEPSKRNLDSAASRASRLYKKLCHIVKRNARPRKVHHHDSQAAGDDAAVDRASTPVFGECLRGAGED